MGTWFWLQGRPDVGVGVQPEGVWLQGCLGVGVGEERAPPGQRVDVRGLNLGVPAQGPDPVVLVVDGNEQNVWFL